MLMRFARENNLVRTGGFVQFHLSSRFVDHVRGKRGLGLLPGLAGQHGFGVGQSHTARRFTRPYRVGNHQRVLAGGHRVGQAAGEAPYRMRREPREAQDGRRWLLPWSGLRPSRSGLHCLLKAAMERSMAVRPP
jgi:hypothetical protein